MRGIVYINIIIISIMFQACTPIVDIVTLPITVVNAVGKTAESMLSGSHSGTPRPATLQVINKFRKLHKGYEIHSIVGSSSCMAISPVALITIRISSGDINKIYKHNLNWTGKCDKGFMHGKGTLSYTLRQGGMGSYLYFDGEMDHGVFIGNTNSEYSRDPRGTSLRFLSSSKVFIELNTHDEYARYEEKDGYDGMQK